MAPNILVTGGAGYIGGSVISALLSHKDLALKDMKLSTNVRSDDQLTALSKLGINVLLFDLNDKAAITNAVLDNEIDIVVHTATSAVPNHARWLIQALGQRRKLSGKGVYYVHSGINASFSEEAGWPSGEVKDDGDVYSIEKQLGPETSPVREVDLLVVEEAKAQGVISYNFPVPNVYGLGSGEWRKVSVAIPAHIKNSIKHKAVYVFDQDATPGWVHISDMSDLYALLVTSIVKGDNIPSGEAGYMFPFAHRASWWSVMRALAVGLHRRGLVASPEPKTWDSYDMAADNLGWPRAHVKTMGTNSGHQVAVKAYERLDWQPKWGEKDLMASIDDEIDDALKYDTIAPSVFKVFKEGRGETA